jgi:hypothetical protein
LRNGGCRHINRRGDDRRENAQSTAYWHGAPFLGKRRIPIASPGRPHSSRRPADGHATALRVTGPSRTFPEYYSSRRFRLADRATEWDSPRDCHPSDFTGFVCERFQSR